MRIFTLSLLLLLISPILAGAPSSLPSRDIEVTPQAIERGKEVFLSYCNACHGLKYYRDKQHPGGISPLMAPEAAAAAFGKAPPDLSLIAKARGKRDQGALYVYHLLTSYYQDESGKLRNRAFAELTQGDGVIAMPPPLGKESPETDQLSHDVAAFLLHAAEPSADERKELGKYVLGYMALLTLLLFLLNRKTWKSLKKPDSDTERHKI